MKLLWAHSEFPFQKLIGIFAAISSLMRANVRREEVPAHVLDDIGIYLLISKWEWQCQCGVRVLCVADKVATFSRGRCMSLPHLVINFLQVSYSVLGTNFDSEILRDENSRNKISTSCDNSFRRYWRRSEHNTHSRGINMHSFLWKDADATKLKPASQYQCGFVLRRKGKIS